MQGALQKTHARVQYGISVCEDAGRSVGSGISELVGKAIWNRRASSKTIKQRKTEQSNKAPLREIGSHALTRPGCYEVKMYTQHLNKLA